MVLNADVRFPTAGTKQRYEVSRSFIEHISDAFIFGTQPDGRKEPAFIVGADDTTCGTITPANWYQEDGTNENVPMADDVTDQRENATIVPTETLSASRATNDATFPEIAVGPDQYLGQGLYFTDGDDRDVWSVFVRPGESVRVATATSNSDTVMEIYDYDGAYVGSNDDCVWPQRYSCVTFQNTTGAPGIYRIDVRPYSGAYAGNDKTYSLTVTRQNDDYSASVPHPVVNSTEWTYGRHEVGSDEDYFYGYMASSCGASCGLLYAFCGASIYQKMEIWQGGVLKVNTSPTANCASAFQNVSLGAGQYTIRVKSTRGVVGNYSMRFYDITDEGSTAASGQDLDALSLPGGGLKIVPRVLHGVNDVDWFKLSPPRGANIHLAVVSQGSSGNPEMTLYGPVKMFCGDGPMSSPDRVACESAQAGETTPLIYNDDGGAYNNSDPAIRFIAPWSGEYYMKVRNKVDLTTGYRLVYYQDHSDYYQPPYLDDVGP